LSWATGQAGLKGNRRVGDDRGPGGKASWT